MSFNESNIKTFISDINLNDHNEAACRIRDKCTQLDNSNDYLVIVYDAVSGWSKHGVSAGKYYNFFRQSGSSGKANIVILYDKKGQVVNDLDTIKRYLELRSDVKMDKNTWDEIVDYGKSFASALSPYKLIANSLIKLANGEDPSDPFKPMIGWLQRHLNSSYNSNEDFIESWGGSETSNLSLWDCKRYNGVYGAWTNSERAIWVVGSEYTMATLKPVS